MSFIPNAAHFETQDNGFVPNAAHFADASEGAQNNTRVLPAALSSIASAIPGLTAVGTGALSGIGDLHANANNFIRNRIGMTQMPNVFDVANYDNPFTNALSKNEEQNPGFATIGKVGGAFAGLGPFSLMRPAGMLAQGLGATTRAAPMADLAFQSAASTPFMDPNASNADIGRAAVLGPLIGSGLNAVGRAGSTLVGNAKANQDIASKAYDAVKSEANERGFQALPKEYGATAQELLNIYEKGGEALKAGNKGIIKSLTAAVKDSNEQLSQNRFGINSGNTDLFTVQNMHDRFQDLSGKINKYLKAGDNIKASQFIALKNAAQSDLNNSMASSGMPDLAKKFFDTQNYYRTQVIPLKQNPTGIGKVSGELAVAHALGGINSQIAEPLAFGFLGHGAGAKGLGIVNWGKRYASPYNGGPASIYSNFGPGNTAASLYGANFGGTSLQGR